MVSTNKALIFAYTLNHKINPLKFSNDDRAQVGKEMDKRTGKQCRERYYNHLREGIKKGYWTPEEDELIKRFHAELGGCWTHIATILDGRTGNAVKNRWHYLNKGTNSESQRSASHTLIPSNQAFKNLKFEFSCLDRILLFLRMDNKTSKIRTMREMQRKMRILGFSRTLLLLKKGARGDHTGADHQTIIATMREMIRQTVR